MRVQPDGLDRDIAYAVTTGWSLTGLQPFLGLANRKNFSGTRPEGNGIADHW
jgi:hypothetical protein